VLLQSVRPSVALTDADRDAAIDAMRIAADKRTEGILGNSRRQHYEEPRRASATGAPFPPQRRMP
jgi:hypothetical protein